MHEIQTRIKSAPAVGKLNPHSEAIIMASDDDDSGTRSFNKGSWQRNSGGHETGSDLESPSHP